VNRDLGAGNPFQAQAAFRVDFADTDIQDRVYYANYFRYFDRARFAYWEAIGCDEADVRRCEEETVLVDVGATYRAPVGFWTQVTAWCRVTRLGRSSLRTAYQVTAAPGGRVIVDGHETLVWFDPRANKTVPIPEAIRRRIEAFEGPRLVGDDAAS
jgi:acyl-CoA thioester hydrolase